MNKSKRCIYLLHPGGFAGPTSYTCYWVEDPMAEQKVTEVPVRPVPSSAARQSRKDGWIRQVVRFPRSTLGRLTRQFL